MLSFEQIKKSVISKVGYANPGMIRDEAISYLNELVKDKHDLVLCVKTETITKNGKTYLDEKIYNNIINKYEQSNKKITRAEFFRKRVGIGAANEIMEYLHPRCYNCKKFIMIPTKVYFANLYLGGYQLGNRIEEFVKKIINSKEGYTRIKIDYSYDKTYFVIESNYYNYDKIQISFTYRFYTKMLDEIIPKLTTNITCSKDCCYEMRKKCNEINLNERFKALLQPNLTKKLKFEYLNTIIPFGKYHGKTISEIYKNDEKYIKWLCENYDFEKHYKGYRRGELSHMRGLSEDWERFDAVIEDMRKYMAITKKI